MKFLQVALLFTFVMLVANVAAHPDPNESCERDQDCYLEYVQCFCHREGIDTPGECRCTGLRTDPPV